ncbi:unnamed protein product [Durusdinium trenchii]|uniref:Uncharacterized protein n=1 Tax=Durusdinium trenchii TaxID=1381693 RepID=A0ABP0LZ53_9DINO
MAPHLEQLQHPPISIDKVPEWQEEEDCCFKLPIQDAASEISKMNLKNPELMRTTVPSKALRFFGRALREKSFDREIYHLSSTTEKVNCFWSHSWHATAWTKILLLLVVYNGCAAVAAGMCAALLGMGLFALGLLPGYPRVFPVEGVAYEVGPWGLVAGCLGTLLVLFLWQPSSSRVFFGRICIHQRDQELKSAGIQSIGGIMKHSETMLVLFEPSYITRLWTIFEIAGFLNTHRNDDGVSSGLIIMPTFLGPTAVAIFLSAAMINMSLLLNYGGRMQTILAVTCVVFCVCANGIHWLRGYFRWIDECCSQLKNFSMEKAHSHCCKSNHLNEAGSQIMCDREIITECIRLWFGSEEAFESCVRSEVSSLLIKGLQRQTFTFRWLVAACVPTCWVCGDLLVARLKVGETYFSIVAGVVLLGWWLGLIPVCALACFVLSSKLRRQRPNGCLDHMVTVMAASLVVVLVLSLYLLSIVLVGLVGDDLLGTCLWAPVVSLATVLAWRVWTQLHLRHLQSG